MQQDDRVAVAVVLVVHRRAQYIHVGHDFLSSRRLRSMGRPSSVTDSLCQPLVTIGASRRSQSEQKRMGDPTRGAGGVMRFRLRR